MAVHLSTPQLTKDANGIWRCGGRSAVSYPSDGNSVCLDLEDSSFWFRHRNRCIVAAMRRLPPDGLLLDIGGGNGFVARGLQDAGFQVAVVEPGEAGSLAARRRGIDSVICGTFQDIGFASSSLPAAGLFDVLEHFADDADLLARIHTALIPGGRLYITVPAYQLLFSDEDRRAGHFRRYSAHALGRLLAQVGFQVEYRSYFFLPLPLPMFAFRTVAGWIRADQPHASAQLSSEHNRTGVAAHIVNRVLDWEIRRIVAGRTIPFGSSCLAIARKV